MGALVGRHVFLSHSRGVCGHGGWNQEESQREKTVAGAQGAVVDANVAVCALHSDGLLSARASAVSRL